MKRWISLAALGAAVPIGHAAAGRGRPGVRPVADGPVSADHRRRRPSSSSSSTAARRWRRRSTSSAATTSMASTSRPARRRSSRSRKALLDDIAEVMKQFPTWRLEVAGHTDATGEPAQNEALSRARAEAVTAALVQRGVADGRLVPEGKGEAEPVASNDTPDGRALNRRVELVRLEPQPNILFIMGDDIGWMQPSIYHRGLMVGETPNIDRIGHEGAMFTDYYAEQSCTAGRNAFFTGMHPLRTGMIPPQLPGQPVLPAARHAGAGQVPARSRLHHRRVRQEPSGRPHRRAADRARLPGILGLSLPPGRDAGGELPRHQQDARPSRRCRRPARTRRSRACPRCRGRSTPRPRPA